jgi:hypothetical protein
MLIQVLLAILGIAILGSVFYIYAYSGYQYYLWVNEQENKTEQDRLTLKPDSG